MRKLHIVNMPFCSALFLKTAIKAAEIFEHLIILSRGPAPSGPLSFCQSFPYVFLQAAEISVFSKVRVCAVERSNKVPSGDFKRRNGLAQQDGGASPRQVHVCAAERSNESPSGAFKRQNGPCISKMEGPRPDKFAFAQRSGAMKAPVGLLSDRTVLRSKMEGPRPDKFTLIRLDFCGSLSTTTIHGRELRTQKFIRCSFLCIR